MVLAKTSRRGSDASIALVLPTLNGGGAERVVLTLAKCFVDRGYRVEIVLAKAQGELLELVPPDVRLVDLGCERLRRVPLPFARYLRRRRPDAVIANMWPLTTLCVLGHRLARSRSRMLVVEHSVWSSEIRLHSWRGRAALRLAMAFNCRVADRCIAVSAGVADDLARLAHVGRERIDVIENPVDISGARAAEPAHGLWDGSSAKRVLSLGRLSPQKNYALLLEAFARLAGDIDARLVILGEGPCRPELERRVVELGLEDVVSLPGFRLDPWSAYASADLFVLSSDHEAFGNVVVEALGAGLPVVSTDCPTGPRKILADGRFGRLVPCGDAAALAAAMQEALAGDHDPEPQKARALEFATDKAADAYLSAALGGSTTSRFEDAGG